MDKYYIVSNEILPDVVESVIEARNLIQSGEVKNISEAIQRVGIPRGTFYRYKDYIFEMTERKGSNRKAVMSLVLHDKRGILSNVLIILNQANSRILSVNQIEPIGRQTLAILAFDITDLNVEIELLKGLLAEVPGVVSVQLIGIE